MRYTLTLTEEQAEILGYALIHAKREQVNLADFYRKDQRALSNAYYERAARIEEIRELLDCCPTS